MYYIIKRTFKTTIMKNIFIIIAAAVISLLLNSCKGAYDFDTENLSTSIDINPDIAIPLIDATVNLEELMPKNTALDNFLQIDNDGFMTLQYQFDVSDVSIDDFLDGEPPSGDNLPYIEYSIPPQKANLGLNNILGQSNLIIADPRIEIYIKNYWNIPVEFKFRDFFYYKDEEGAEKFPVTGTAVTEWKTITPFSSPDTYSITEIALNNTNSNIDEVLSSLPHHLSFGADFRTITPSGAYNVPTGITDSIKLSIEIPLDIGLENIIMSDTISFSFENADSDMIEKLTIGTIIDNGFPLSLNIQFDFIDEDGNVLTSLFENGLSITGGEVDASGKIKNSVESTNVSETDKEVIKKMLSSKSVVYKITLNTTGIESGKTVKLYNNYEIGIKMGARFKIKP